MIIKKVNATKSELSSTLDLSSELDGLTKSDKKDALREIGEYLVEQTLVNAAESNSIVRGENIPALKDKNYKALKKLEVGNTKANLELTGRLLDSVDYKLISDSELKIGVFGKEAPKADGHNNFSGKSLLPQRRIFPGKDQGYIKSVNNEILAIIADKKAESETISTEDLQDIETKTEFYSVIKSKLGVGSIAEARLAILRNQTLLNIVEELGLDEYL